MPPSTSGSRHPMRVQQSSHWIRNKVTSSPLTGREPGLTLSPSYTRPLQNSKAATLGVKPTHLLCISVEGVAGPTTTTPPSLHHHLTWCQAHPPPLYLCRGGGRVHHHHSTFTPPSPPPSSPIFSDSDTSDTLHSALHYYSPPAILSCSPTVKHDQTQRDPRPVIILFNTSSGLIMDDSLICSLCSYHLP